MITNSSKRCTTLTFPSKVAACVLPDNLQVGDNVILKDILKILLVQVMHGAHIDWVVLKLFGIVKSLKLTITAILLICQWGKPVENYIHEYEEIKWL